MEKLKEEYDRYFELLKAREFFLNILLTAKVENKEYKEKVKKVEEELAHYDTVLIEKFGKYLKTGDQELKDFFSSKVTTLKVGYTRVNVRKKAKEEHTSTNDMEKLKEEYNRYFELYMKCLSIIFKGDRENKKEEIREEMSHYDTVLIEKFGKYLKTGDQELKDFFSSKVTTLKVGYTRVNVRKKAKEEHTSTNGSVDPNVSVESSNGLPPLPPDWKEYRKVDQNYEPMIDSHDAFIQLMERKKVQIIPLVEVSFSRRPQRIKKKIKVKTVKKEELSKKRKKLANLDKNLLLFHEKASYQIVGHDVNFRDNTCHKINEKHGRVCGIPKSSAREIKNLFVNEEERKELKNQISEVKVRKRALKGTNKGYVMMGMLTTGIVIIIAATIFMIINNALNH